MTSPAPVVMIAPEVITARPRKKMSVPAPKMRLTNRAAGRLKAEGAPPDTGFASTRYAPTRQDAADVAATEAPLNDADAAAAQRTRATAMAAAAEAAPEDTGLASASYQLTKQDIAEAAATEAPLYDADAAAAERTRATAMAAAAEAAPQDTSLASASYQLTGQDLTEAASASTDTGERTPTAAAEPPDVGLAGTHYELTEQDTADVATAGQPLVSTASPVITGPAGPPPRGALQPESRPGATGSITTPAQLVQAAQAAAAALPEAVAPPDTMTGRLATVTGSARARADAYRAVAHSGGRRVPLPPPFQPLEIDPVPASTAAIMQALNARLPDLQLPRLRPMPDGSVPVLDRKTVQEATRPGELGTEIRFSADDTAAVVGQKNAEEKNRRKQAIDAAREPVTSPEQAEVEIYPPVVVDHREVPPPLPPVPQRRADTENMLRSLARVQVGIGDTAQDIVQSAREAAFPVNRMGTHYNNLTDPMRKPLEKDLDAEIGKLSDAMRIAPAHLEAAAAKRRDELTQIAAGQAAHAEAVVTAATQQLTREAKKKLAKEAAAGQRADQELARRLPAALHSSDRKNIASLADKRMTVIDDDVATGVVAIEAAGRRRMALIDSFEDAYRNAYRAADNGHAVNEGDKLWFDVANDELRAEMAVRRDATRKAQEDLTKALLDAGTSARAAVWAWSDKRTKAKLDAEAVQARAAKDAALQSAKIDKARTAAEQAASRDALVGEMRLVVAVAQQDADDRAGNLADQAQRIGGAALKRAHDLLKAGRGDPIEAIAAAIRSQFAACQKPKLAQSIHDEVYKLSPSTEKEMYELGDVIFPESPGELQRRVNKLWRAFERIGTDEEAVYQALSGLDDKQRHLLGMAYHATHDEYLADRIDDEMSGDEYRRAIGLYRGDRTMVAEALIGLSEHWYGNDKEMALGAIRDLPPHQADAVANDPETKARLQRVLADWKETGDGRYQEDNRAQTQLQLMLELKRIEPKLAPGSSRQEISPEQRDLQARIDAVEIDRAIRRGGKVDLDAMQKVYDRMRETLKADQRTANWSAEDFDAELRRRTRAMENAYEKEFGGELPKGGVSALRTALTERLVGGEKLDIAVAQLDVDRAGELAGRLQLATRGFFASDSDINKALAVNYERATAEVARSEAKQDEVKAKADALIAAAQRRAGGRHLSSDELAAYRKEATEFVTMELATSWGKDVTKRFGGKYAESWGGNADTALQEMLVDTTQFNGEKEALARLGHGGGLTVSEQVQFGVAGWGMDRDQVVGALEGRTKEQLAEIGAQYRQDYGEDMTERLKAESGGWSDEKSVSGLERNAFDVREALRGVPVTPDEQLARAGRRLDFEKNTYFASNPYERGQAVGFELAAMQDQYDRAVAANAALVTATGKADPIAIRQAQAEFRNREHAVQLAADDYRQAVDEYVDRTTKIVSIAAAVAAAAVIEAISFGAATPLIAAVAASVAGTAASMAEKSRILGAAYGKQQIRDDLIVGAVDAAVSAATFRLGDILLKVPGLKTVMRPGLFTPKNELKAAQAALAAVRGNRPLIARAGALVVQHLAQGAPTAITATLLDRKSWRDDIGTAVLRSGAMAGVMNVAIGTGMHGVQIAAGKAGHAFGELLRRPGHEIGPESVVLRSVREAAELRAPHEPMTSMGTPTERLAAQREYLARFPDRTPADFRAALERGTAQVEATAQDIHELRREMTRELLAGIPPAERARHLDTPILVLSDQEFTARTGSATRGHAVTVIVNGEPVVVLREGAPLSSLREEGIHVRQIRDQANAAQVAVLDESRLARWNSASLEERMAAWKAKLDLEVEAQQQLISDLNHELAKPELRPEVRADLVERLNDARAAHEILSGRRVELEGIDPATQAQMKEGKVAPPAYLSEEPRLFAKKSDRPELPTPDLNKLEDTANPRIKMGPIEIKQGKAYRVVVTFTPKGAIEFEQFEWEGKVGISAGEATAVKRKGKEIMLRWVRIFNPERGEVLVTEQEFSKNIKAWKRSGPASRFGGAVAEMAGRAEMAGKAEAAARMGVAGHEVKEVRFSSQDEGGRGFDDVLLRFAKKADGSVIVDISSDEMKDYPTDPVRLKDLGAIRGRRFSENLNRLRLDLEETLKKGTWADAGMTKSELQAALQAVREKRLTITTRLPPGTELAGDPLQKLEGELRKDHGPGITVRPGEPIRLSNMPEAELWFMAQERYRARGAGPRVPGGVELFKRLARRPSGITPESIRTAEAVVFASANPKLGINPEKVSWAPRGGYLVDDVGPLVVISPQASTNFDPVRVADQILDTAAQNRPYAPDKPAPASVGKDAAVPAPPAASAPTRVLIDYGDLRPGQAQALQDALQAQALKRQLQDVAARCLPVAFPRQAAPKHLIR